MACGPCPPVNGQCVGEVTNGTQYEITGWPNFDNHSWHTYGLLWTNTGNNATDQMTYFIDGAMMGVLKLGAAQSALKSDMFLTINLALGGTLGGPIQITDWADAYMDVDYVRWYRSGQNDSCGLGSGSGGVEAGVDADSDAGADGGVEAGADAGLEAGTDASIEAGADADAVADAGVDAGGAADATADAGPSCTCSGVGMNGPVTVTCGQTTCGQDSNTYGMRRERLVVRKRRLWRRKRN